MLIQTLCLHSVGCLSPDFWGHGNEFWWNPGLIRKVGFSLETNDLIRYTWRGIYHFWLQITISSTSKNNPVQHIATHYFNYKCWPCMNQCWIVLSTSYDLVKTRKTNFIVTTGVKYNIEFAMEQKMEMILWVVAAANSLSLKYVSLLLTQRGSFSSTFSSVVLNGI